MQSDFNNVETELRDIENAFATGRMNAFGSASTQDAFVHELRRIAEIETQVFYRTCALLKSSNTNEHTLVTNMYASAQPPPQAQRAASAASNGAASGGVGGVNGGGGLGEGSRRASTNGLDSSVLLRSGSPPLAGSALNGSRAGIPTSGVPRSQSRQGRESMVGGSPVGGGFGFNGIEGAHSASGAAPHVRPTEWTNEDGFSDKAFEDVAAHFDELESQFTSLGDYLREISKHVIRLNDMSEQVNSGAALPNSVGASSASGAGNAQPSNTTIRRGRVDSFDEDGNGLRFEASSTR